MNYDTGRIYIGKDQWFTNIAGKMKVKNISKELKS